MLNQIRFLVNQNGGNDEGAVATIRVVGGSNPACVSHTIKDNMLQTYFNFIFVLNVPFS